MGVTAAVPPTDIKLDPRSAREPPLPAFDFFAAERDLSAVAAALFAVPGVRVAEADSALDCELAVFRSTAELLAAFPPLPDRIVPPLVLWSPAVTPTLEITTIALDPTLCDGHTTRQSAEGDGLVRVTLGGVRGRAVVRSGLTYTPPGPRRNRGGIDWAALDALFGRVAGVIGGMAAGTVPGRPVLPRAYELALSGFVLKDTANAKGHTVPVAVMGRPAAATTAVRLGRTG